MQLLCIINNTDDRIINGKEIYHTFPTILFIQPPTPAHLYTSSEPPPASPAGLHGNPIKIYTIIFIMILNSLFLFTITKRREREAF